jgi:hypothetical protein
VRDLREGVGRGRGDQSRASKVVVAAEIVRRDDAHYGLRGKVSEVPARGSALRKNGGRRGIKCDAQRRYYTQAKTDTDAYTHRQTDNHTHTAHAYTRIIGTSRHTRMRLHAHAQDTCPHSRTHPSAKLSVHTSSRATPDCRNTVPALSRETGLEQVGSAAKKSCLCEGKVWEIYQWETAGRDGETGRLKL